MSKAGRVMLFFFFSSRRRHTRFDCDWSSDVCSSDLVHVDVWVPLMLAGTHEVVNPAGDAAVRETAPLKPPVDWREIVEEADCPGTNEIGRASCRERV